MEILLKIFVHKVKYHQADFLHGGDKDAAMAILLKRFVHMVKPWKYHRADSLHCGAWLGVCSCGVGIHCCASCICCGDCSSAVLLEL